MILRYQLGMSTKTNTKTNTGADSPNHHDKGDDGAVAHTDIQLVGWWQKMPQGMRPYLYLARLDRPIGWWLLLLPAWWTIALAASTPAAMVTMMALFMIGAISMRGAGCVINDMWDRRIDLRVERTRGRPLAAGTIRLVQALGFVALLCVIGLGVLLQLPQTAVLVGMASLPLIVLYPLAKRVTWWPQFVLGLTFSWGVPLGWAAAANSWPDLAIWLIYAGSVAWVFGYDTIYAVQDMVDDRIAGVKSSALGFGKQLNRGVHAAFCLAILLISTGLHIHLGPGIWMVGVALMAIHLLRQARTVTPDDPQGALALFKSNRNAGLILTVFLIIDRMVG
jgi:4-hydroxybenzoate polyprenyltransferase